MIIVLVAKSNSNIARVQLPRAIMVVDPGVISFFGVIVRSYQFSFSVNGTTLTITRLDGDGDWPRAFNLHAYMPSEETPDCTSTLYTY